MGRVAELSECRRATDTEIRNEYFQWLCSLVGADEPDHSYMLLCRYLHNKEFVWAIRNDENRADDGCRLRDIFADETYYDDYRCLDEPCSVMEMLIALAIRIAENFDDGEEEAHIRFWYWKMIENLWGLNMDDLNDQNFTKYGFSYYTFEDKLNVWMSRQFRKDGLGGIFPLKFAQKNQRRLEIWYQMQSYLIENCHF